MALTLNPAVLVYLFGAGALYVRAVRTLHGRGHVVNGWQQAAWYGGLGLSAIALVSPVDGLGDDLLTMHMAQHLLIADLAAPLLIVGVRNPVLAFMLPKPLLVPLARSRLRTMFRFVRQPLVALPIFVLLLYGWHVKVLFEAALRSDVVHALQHMSFFWGSLLVWWAVLEPKRRRMPGELWKIGHIFAARLFSAMLGMGLIFSRSPWYSGAYGNRARDHGLSPLADQQTAGGMMMSLDVLIITFALTLFFWRAAADFDRKTAEPPKHARAPAPSEAPLGAATSGLARAAVDEPFMAADRRSPAPQDAHGHGRRPAAPGRQPSL